MKNLKVPKAAAGFTLVELMVVVAIIGILAAVAAPRVQQFRARGIQAEAKANLNSIYLAQAAFQDANDKFADAGNCPPNAACDGGDGADFPYRTNVGAKYKYAVEGDNGRWSAGAASKQKILKNLNDVWRINTNKVLCATSDAVAGGAMGNTGDSICTAGTVSDDGVPDLTDADNPF
ncbi:MAG: pilin [Pseudomonadota bacterium]|jgi:prepilin-type N-terminal cleavage/methylation domain-containing protein